MVAAQGDFMTLPSLRQRLKSGTPFLAPFSIIPAVEVVEAIGLAGFDGVILDLEHGAHGSEALGPLILAAMEWTGQRRTEAAQRLGIGRNTISRKMQELGLD